MLNSSANVLSQRTLHAESAVAIDALQKMQTLTGVKVQALCTDSRKILRDDAFVACRGLCADGRDYIVSALQAGARGVFWESEGFQWPEHLQVPNVAIDNLAMSAGWLADAVYESPSTQMPVLAVTATNGKTTASYFTAQLLAAQKIPCGIIGTLGMGMTSYDFDSQNNNQDIKINMHPSANTTPDAVTVHRQLRDFIVQGAQAAVLEASSHGIVQERLCGALLKAAALINIGRDHLDYHGTMEEYRRVKMQLLQTHGLQTAILNADVATECKTASGAQLQTFGKQGNAMRLVDWMRMRQGR